MAKAKVAPDPWERLEQLVAETEPSAPENSFTLEEVSARKGWKYSKTNRWLTSQVKIGNLLKHAGRGRQPAYYYFPPKV